MTDRKSTHFVLLLLLIFLALSTGLLMHVPDHTVQAAPQDTIVRCEPASIASDFTTPASFKIYVENVSEMNAADVRMDFDTSIVHIQDADPDMPNTQIEILDEFLAPDFVVRDWADNSEGTIWYANTQVNPTPPVSGSGALARVTLLPQKAGKFTMHFTHNELVRGNGTEIPSTAQDCIVLFYDPNQLEFGYLPVVLTQ
ncbi:MAG: cohesin domain-containing protein [Anaerolineales bacterium]|jgi:hypothetical protein